MLPVIPTEELNRIIARARLCANCFGGPFQHIGGSMPNNPFRSIRVFGLTDAQKWEKNLNEALQTSVYDMQRHTNQNSLPSYFNDFAQHFTFKFKREGSGFRLIFVFKLKEYLEKYKYAPIISTPIRGVKSPIDFMGVKLVAVQFYAGDYSWYHLSKNRNLYQGVQIDHQATGLPQDIIKLASSQTSSSSAENSSSATSSNQSSGSLPQRLDSLMLNSPETEEPENKKRKTPDSWEKSPPADPVDDKRSHTTLKDWLAGAQTFWHKTHGKKPASQRSRHKPPLPRGQATLQFQSNGLTYAE